MKQPPYSKQSLSEVHGSVQTQNKKGFWRKLLAFSGPAYLISVGYMDPGNWATDIAGGSQFGYSLIWVLLMSNLMALLLQSLSARLGIVRGMDLAQVSRESYPPVVNICLYILAEIAIAACDLAEVLGMAIGLQLLFGLPLLTGVGISVADTLLLLFLQKFGVRKIESLILGLVFIIGLAFLAEMFFVKPLIADIAKGFIPSIPNHAALYIAIGIIGATVMPHNLYLHSALVQTRKLDNGEKGIRSAIKYNLIDSSIALNVAFFVNAAILVLAASTFFKNGLFQVADIQDAHQFLAPLIGNKWAPTLFAIALIAAGQSSTITGTLAGQVVMEGYLNLRIQPWLRRLLTRLMAVIPAFLTIYLMGEQVTGKLLIFSQVILSLQLGFAIVPLIHFVSDKTKMGVFAIGKIIKILAWLCAALIILLNINLVYSEITEKMTQAGNPIGTSILVFIASAGLLSLLLYIIFRPFFPKKRLHKKSPIPHGFVNHFDHMKHHSYQKIAVAIDFSKMDILNMEHAIAQGGKNAEYLLIHVVETAGAQIFGSDIEDHETESDRKNMQQYADMLLQKGYRTSFILGFGNPKSSISNIVNESKADLLVMGAHGHKGFKDIIFGTTVDAVRHRVQVPVFIVKTND